MPIRPPGSGWLDGPQPESSVQSAYAPRRSSLTCKVCDSGTLSPKKVFRLSGPAVVIGFILLIPSLIGMIVSGLILVGFITLPAAVPAARHALSTQSAFDSSFRRSCAANVRQNVYRTSGLPATQASVESYCECALSTYKETGSETIAAQTCNQQAQDGRLNTPSQDVDALYSSDVQQQGPAAAGNTLLPTAVLSFFGSVGAVAMGIAFFVGGLLGWLLVMRKRVLQCDYCGAVVNAS